MNLLNTQQSCQLVSQKYKASKVLLILYLSHNTVQVTFRHLNLGYGQHKHFKEQTNETEIHLSGA